MRRIAALVVPCLLLAACASHAEQAVEDGEAQMVNLGEYFDTSRGQVFLLRIQDEYRLIRCIPEGPIAGCYEDVFTISSDAVDWNEWVDVGDVPGLRVAFLSPTALAVTRDEAVPPAPDAK